MGGPVFLPKIYNGRDKTFWFAAGVGKVKARRTMEAIGIADSRRIRGLGEQQRKIQAHMKKLGEERKKAKAAQAKP